MSVAIITTQVGASFAKEMIGAMSSPLGAVWLRWAFSTVFLALGILPLNLISRGRGSRQTTQSSGVGAQSVGVGSHAIDSVEIGPDEIDPIGSVDAAAFRDRAERRPLSSGPRPPTSAQPFASQPPTPLSQRRTQALYIVCLLLMNFCIYEAFARIPVGIAVTVEFLGPLGVAIAGSRARIDLLWVALAGTGVALLSFHPAQLDWAGVGFALLAAACWAGHITLGAKASADIGPVALLAVAYAIGTATISIPMFVGENGTSLTGDVIRLAVIVALTTSALTLPLELFALSRIAPALFAIIQSMAPACAAVFAWIVIGEQLGVGDCFAIVLVSVAACGATLRRPQTNLTPPPSLK